MIKKLLSFIKLILNLINLPFFLIINFYVILNNFKKKKNIILHVEGGFGHTITTPLLLNYYYGNNYLLLFRYSKKRHNKYIKKIFPNLVFITTSIFNFESFTSNRIFFCCLYFILKKFTKKNVLLMDEFYQQVPTSKLNNTLKTCNVRSRLFWLMKKKKFKFIKNSDLKISETYLKDIFQSKKKNLLFVIRNKDFKLHKDEVPRDTRDMNFYKNTLEFAVKSGWRVFLTGNIETCPKWIEKNQEIFWSGKLEIEDDYYMFLAGMFNDACIGPHSGALWYNLSRKSPCLVFEHTFLGDTMPNSISSYRNIASKNYKMIKKYFNQYDFETLDIYKKFYKNSYKLSKKQSDEIIRDFLKNCNKPSYGYDVRNFGITKSLFNDCNSKLSPVWAKYNFLKV